jgi:hypothetical protein
MTEKRPAVKAAVAMVATTCRSAVRATGAAFRYGSLLDAGRAEKRARIERGGCTNVRRSLSAQRHRSGAAGRDGRVDLEVRRHDDGTRRHLVTTEVDGADGPAVRREVVVGARVLDPADVVTTSDETGTTRALVESTHRAPPFWGPAPWAGVVFSQPPHG